MQGKAIQSQHDLAGDPKNKFSNDDNNILVKELVGAKIWTTMKNRVFLKNTFSKKN